MTSFRRDAAQDFKSDGGCVYSSRVYLVQRIIYEDKSPNTVFGFY